MPSARTTGITPAFIVSPKRQLQRSSPRGRRPNSDARKLDGEEHYDTLREANNYASLLGQLNRFEEAKALLRKTVPVAHRVLGADNRLTLKMRWVYAGALCNDPAATLDDLREVVTTLEDTERISRRVLGGAHPLTVDIDAGLRDARAALRAREARA